MPRKPTPSWSKSSHAQRRRVRSVRASVNPPSHRRHAVPLRLGLWLTALPQALSGAKKA